MDRQPSSCCSFLSRYLSVPLINLHCPLHLQSQGQASLLGNSRRNVRCDMKMEGLPHLLYKTLEVEPFAAPDVIFRYRWSQMQLY